MAVAPNFWVTVSLYIKKECLPVITQNKKHSLKQIASWYTHLGKIFLQLLLVKVCETFLLRQSKNASGILWFVWDFFAFLGKRNQIDSVHENKTWFSICRYLVWCAKRVNIFWKITVQNLVPVSTYFCGGHKNNLKL